MILLIAFFVVVCGIYLNDLLIQAISFLVLSLLLLSISGDRNLFLGFRVMAPFLISLIIIYFIFGFLKVSTQDKEPGTLIYWLVYGARRILLFVNSFLAVKLFFALVSFDELLLLPLKIGVQKYIILGKILYGTSFSAYSRLTFYQRLIPTEQVDRQSFSHRFKVRLSTLLALMLTLMSDAKEKGQLIDNRLLMCHGLRRPQTGVWYLTLAFTVMVTVATMIIPIPVPGGGFFNFGDVMIVFVGLYAGKKAGAIAGGVGSAIADLLLFPLFAPVTLLVKGTEGFICGLAYRQKGLLRFLLPLVGCSIMVAGYFIGEWLMPQLGKAIAISDLPVNIVQASVGFIGGRLLFEAARYLDL